MKYLLENFKMGVKVLAGFIAFFFASIFGHLKKESPKMPNTPTTPTLPPPTPTNPALPKAPNTTNYTVDSWVPFLNALLPRDVPFVFAKNYITIESGGKPCAVGSLTAKGPDGYPREQGIAQVYNPDDFKSQGIRSGALRVYCTPGTQQCSRPLTAQEMAEQVKSLILLIKAGINHANRTLIANGASTLPGWKSSHEDFWRLVKMVHGLPGLVSGMAFVTRKLGRPPAGWNEFKDQVITKGVKLDAGTERYRARFPAIFANAEKAADGVGASIS